MRKTLFITSIMSILLTSCSSDVKSTLGMKKPAPDEFLVISNPPLSVPPSFNLVAPGAEPALESAATEVDYSTLDEEDKALLQVLGSNNGTTNAKAIVDKDYYEQKKEKHSKGAIRNTISKLQGDGNKVIDPVAERERINANLSSGKPVNEGQVKDKSESTLKRIFN